MHNPGLGAVLIWRFVCGFTPESSPAGTPLPLAFVVLPLAFHARSLEAVMRTQPASGIRLFEEKFRERSDVLLSLQPRVLAMRMLSLRAIRVGVRTGLLTLVPSEAVLWPRSRSMPPLAESKGVKELVGSAEKLGRWCRDISMFEIAGTLKVDF